MKVLETIARDAIAACNGEAFCRGAVADVDVRGRRVHLVGAGKAAVQMARGAASGLPRGALAGGLLATKDDHHGGFPPDGVEVVFAGHPVPDERSARAGLRLADYVYLVPRCDLVIGLISGGSSSLLASPVEGLSLADIAATTRALLAGGVAIGDANAVRKHIGIAAGGRLARACAADVEVLTLSDVLGDDASTIGSGPFAPDASTFEEALRVARGVEGIPPAVLAYLARGVRGAEVDTPDADAACFSRVRQRIVANHDTLRDAAAHAAKARGFSRVRRLDPCSGDIDLCASALAQSAREVAAGEIVIGGGEPTVRLPADHGTGGRNQQLALMLARDIAGLGVAIAVVGSDGSDGTSDAAGACIDGDSWALLARHGDPATALARFDAAPILERAGLQIRTGATATNLLDLHLVCRLDAT